TRRSDSPVPSTPPSSVFLSAPPPPSSTLFPYTTLFRSARPSMAMTIFDSRQSWDDPGRGIQLFGTGGKTRGVQAARAERTYAARSEEHTSELQSRENLVCRLLLEKKKNKKKKTQQHDQQ